LNIIDELKAKVEGKNMKIVFPEGEDVRIMGAAIRLKKDGLITPILLGNIEEIEKVAKENNFDISDIEVIQPEKAEDFEELVDAFVERRKGKATKEQALE